MSVYYSDDLVTLHHGDCVEVMRSLPEASVDAVVTDPPYGLEFMGKDWDCFAPDNMIKRSGWETADDGSSIKDETDKPFGRVAFHKRRKTYQCTDCGKRDGFRNEHPCGDKWAAVWVDDKPVESMAFGEWSRQWAVEAYRVLKPGGHLLAFGGTRTWHRLAVAIEDAGFEIRDSCAWLYASGFPKSLDVSKAIDKRAGAERDKVPATGGLHKNANLNDDGWSKIGDDGALMDSSKPATPAAQQWQGWGTALKPAFEPIVVARKPLDGTVAENVLRHGTGALNIDGSRIAGDVPSVPQPNIARDNYTVGGSNGRNGEMSSAPLGRWPANVILDESQAAELDRQSGDVKGAVSNGSKTGAGLTGSKTFAIHEREQKPGYNDTGGASRFFYVPKAGASERPRDGATAHPTVKPLDLMRYLVKLVTPPGGTVLEPFAGSGTTLEACVIEGFHVIGIELTEDYLPLIVQRLSKPTQQVLL